jgi:P-type conjugative transfer protein TrbJ
MMKRSQVLGVLVALASVLGARSASAQWAVVDASNIAQSIKTVLNTAQTVSNTYTQIQNQKTQIENELQTLKSIDPTTFSGLMALLDQGKVTYAMIQNDIDSMGFTVQQINQDFDGLFPKDKTKWKSVKYGDYDNYYTRWNTEITASSKAADRAQSSLADVEYNNAQIAKILAQAQGANGEVRQLQLINQQLALIHKELGALVQNLATAGRVNSNMAASSAGEKMLEREAALRRRQGYTNAGRPAQALKHLP